MAFVFFSGSYWVKLRLIKVQQTLSEATVVFVVIVVAVLLLFLLMFLFMALLVVTDPIVNICGQ